MSKNRLIKTNCVVCSIPDSQERHYIVYQDKKFIAFLDIKPVFKGHCLLSPKKHYSTLYDLPKKDLQGYFSILQRLGLAIEKVRDAQGTFIGINNKVSQSIPHLHTHVIPRSKDDGLKGFFWPRVSYESELEKKEIQTKIQTEILKLKEV
jgi:histidine triad (HIT) family protein